MANRAENTKRRKKKGGSPILRFIGTFFLIALVTGAMLACMAVMYVKIVIMPDVSLQLADYSLDLTTTVYYTDENGNDVELQRLHGAENRIWIKYEDIPKNLVNAAVAIEDKRFYKHNGVDWIRTVRGIMSMFTGQDIQGGSTLTQQLIKNLTTEDQVTVKRKVKEIFRALEFEKNNSKEEILEWYLNCIYLGENCNGVYTASYAYFGKHVSELTLAECASLIGITNNPSKFNPYLNTEKREGKSTNLERNKERQTTILWQMFDQGYITQEEWDQATAQELTFLRGEDNSREVVAYSYFMDALIDQVIDDLIKTQNLSEKAAAMKVYSGGLKIYTSYKPQVQAAVDSVYNDRSNLNYTSNSGQVMQSAITIIDDATGNVVAMAGGVGEKTESRSFNRATQSKRPPGSAIKPLSVYAPALDMGLVTPLSVAVDSPFKDGWPINSYGSYRGAMTVTEAVRVSSNTVAVKVLDMVTPDVSFQFMRDRFNIHLVEQLTVGTSIYSDIDYGPLALGGLTEGVSTAEMAAAYSAFARDGVYYKPSTYVRVVDSDGNTILERDNNGEVILKEKTVYYITTMLQNVVASGTGKAANFYGQEIAGKTGTTSSRKDLWFVGYTPYYTAAVWTGYDQQEKMSSNLGNPSAALFQKVMQKVHATLPYKTFNSPDTSELVWVKYCATTGNRATDYCPTGSGQLFKEDVPQTTCKAHTKSEVTPPAFDISDESTWPKDDPKFNPEDPSTWPSAGGSTNGEDAGSGGAGGTGDGQTEPNATNPPTPTNPDPLPSNPVEGE